MKTEKENALSARLLHFGGDLVRSVEKWVDVLRGPPSKQALPLARYIGRRLVVLGEKDSVRSAARAMEANNIGAVLIEDRGGLVGLITDRDLALDVVGYHGDFIPL